MNLSKFAQSIQKSSLLSFANEVNRRRSAGEKLSNLTIGDFDPTVFPLPEELKQQIIQAYQDNQTNYSHAMGQSELRHSVADLLARICAVEYSADNIQIASGSRPLLYAAYKVMVDPGDKVIYPVPSWNNDQYTHMLGAQAIKVETSSKNGFMPTADDLLPHIRDARLLSLCSPQNPTGTVFSRDNLTQICQMVVKENRRRSDDHKPLYIMFDQVYWLLTLGNTTFHHPIKLCPELREYAVFIDGMSKSFVGTGIRVGWSAGPAAIISCMRTLILHVGAWAPKPEQIGTAAFLRQPALVDEYLSHFRRKIEAHLGLFYDGFMHLKQLGYNVDAIKPQATIYLAVKIDLVGKITANDEILHDEQAVHQYLLNEATIGILPFAWFGADKHKNWYRLSIGMCQKEDITTILADLEQALQKLSTA